MQRELEKALADVIDPETGLSIMRMEIIHDLRVEEGGEVSLTFRPTSPQCPMAYALAGAVKEKLQAVNWVGSVTMKVENFNKADHLQSLLNPPPAKGA
jgi:metal-sulfur cluster biosynthetic enzyme